MIVPKNFGFLTSLFIGILLSIETTQGVSAQQASISLGSTISDPTKKNKKRKKIWEMGADAAIISEQNESEDTEILVEEEEPSALKQCELGFEGVKMILQQKKGKPDRVILDGSLKGVAKPGRMLGIMGPSGSGKSTLIHALAGRIQESKKIQVFGKRYINGELLADDSTIPVAFIEQDVNFFPHMVSWSTELSLFFVLYFAFFVLINQLFYLDCQRNS
jgi:ABC-type glutathione transport system ATPase component